ncbi:hypothetical protein IT087_03735 [Candidatus Uhrbacteria bacterium]|nr:hypothetical protein [Candidatus Uhrbacteria bacterium]
MGFKETMIGNPTGKTPEQRPIQNPNEGYGNWKDEMGKPQPISAEAKAKREADSRAYEEKVMLDVQARINKSPSPEAPQDPNAWKKGHVMKMPAVTPELIAQMQAQEAEKKTAAKEEKGVKGFFKRLFS